MLELTREMKLLKLGNVFLDGTKEHANASRDSALSHERIETLEIQLKAEVQELLSTLRDTLLPRLISGQLRLPEAEAAVATAP